MNLKKLLNENTYEFFRKTYLVAFIMAVLTRVLLPVALHETQFVNTLVFSFVAIFGAGIILIDFFTKRVFLRQKNIIWLLFFLVVCLISSVINVKYGVLGNIRNLVWLAISFLLLYPIDGERSTDDVKKEIKFVTNILILVWFVACAVSLVMFLFQIGFYVDVYPDSFARLGFIEGRLFGVFEDPNYAAVVAIAVILFSIFNIKNSSKKFLKILYFLNIVVNFCYVVLSGSRTAEVSAIIVMFLSAYFVLLQKFKDKEANLILKQLVLIGASLLCSFVLIFSIVFTRKMLSYLPELVGAPFQTESVSEPRIRKHVDTTREDVNNSADVSNCRFKIWQSALELFRSKPIFGTSPRNMRTYAKAEFPNGFIAQRSYAVHNAYLDVLTSTGIVGALAVIVFFVKYLIFVFKFLFLNLKSKHYYMVLFNFSVVATVAMSAFFLSEIFFVNTIGVLVFWLNLGYSCYFIDKDNIECKDLAKNV